jgi:photosystem II stability/assembly factor-like uncharacterized protein
VFTPAVFRRFTFTPLLAVLLPALVSAQGFDSTAFAGMRWREIGPYRGGRSVAVAGSSKRQWEYYMGTTGGGVFKTTDGGSNWMPVTDRYFGGTVGALAVSESNPDIVWAAGGEGDIRGNTAPGDGVWVTKNAGRTWTKIPFFDVKNHVRRLRIHPTNPDIVWIGILGHAFGTSEQRGMFKTTDGGKTWKKVLYRNDATGVSDFDVDPSNPDILYAAFWHAYRTPWSLNSGGPGGGIFKSTDGGENWTELTNNPGLPKGVLGKIGVSVSPAKGSRIFALIEADEGGVYRSDDAGATWTKLNEERKLRQRAWYYSRIVADPKDTNTVYALNVSWFRSRDGGKTFPTTMTIPHGDNHDLWIAPNDPDRMIQGNDGGAAVSNNGGRTWTDEDFATAQMYHVTTTNHFPYKVCGAQQDNSTLCGPSRKEGGIQIADWMEAGGGESGYIAAHPKDPDIVFAGSYGGLLTRKDMRTGLTWDINPWPDNPMGHSSEDIKYRFQWTFPIYFSPHDANTMYVGGSQLFMTHDMGQSYEVISPELARRDPKTMGASGGPITKDQTGVETYGVIFAFDESPLQKGVLWAGTDDGLVHVSKDGGKTWKNVTPRDIGDFTRISLIEAGHFNAGTAYVAANRFQQDDFQPLLYKTSDFGATWTKIVNGIPAQEFTRAIREDPTKKGLLYAGTERGVWVSFDDGANWQSLRLNLPLVPVHDLVIKQGDLVIGTHGRSFYILDDLSPIRQMTPATVTKDGSLYKPRDTYRIDWGGRGFGGGGGQHPAGANPPSGVQVYYTLKEANQLVTLDFLDAKGAVIKSYTSEPDSTFAADSVKTLARHQARIDSLVRTGITADSAKKALPAPRFTGPAFNPFDDSAPRRPPPPSRVANKKGLNAFAWNLRYPDAVLFDGLVLWAGDTRGPIAPQGTYSVRMSVNGSNRQSQTFRLANDPRAKATAEEQLAQFNFLIKIRDKLSEANDAVISMRDLKSQVDDRLKKAPAPAVQELSSNGTTLKGTVTDVEKEVYQIKNQSGQDPLNFPIRLNNKIAALNGVVSSAPGRPTAQAMKVYGELAASLEKEMVRMKKVYSDDVVKYNELLKKHGLAPLVPKAAKGKPTVAADYDDDARERTRW